MATQLQIRRGTATQVAAFTGAEGEIVVNTTNDSVHVNDGSTQGGFELARVDGANWNVTNNISTTGSVTAASLVVDTTTLVVDASNNMVGIGTSSPSQPFHVDATGGTTAALFDNNGSNGDVVRVAKNGTDVLKIRAEGTADLALDANGGSFIFKEGGTEAMRILSNQRVSIGGSSSNHLLNVTSSTTPALEFTRGSGNATIGIDNGNSIAVGGTAGDLVLRASGTTGVTKFTDSGGNITMTLTEANNVGIGTSSPGAALDINRATGTASYARVGNGGNVQAYIGVAGDNLPVLGSFTNHALRMVVNASEVARFDTSGRLGLGTTSPSALVDLGTSTGQKLLMYASNNIKYGMSIETSEYRIFAEDQAVLTFGHMARSDGSTYTERARITAAGSILAGRTSAIGGRIEAHTLGFSNSGNDNWKKGAFVGTGNFGGAISLVNTGGGSDGFCFYLTGNPSVLNIQHGSNGGTMANGVQLSSTATAFAAFSDLRLKNVTSEISDAVQSVNSLRAVKYTFKDDDTATPRVGLIAQEVQAVLPEAIDVVDDDGHLGVRYTEIIPLLVAAIKEQKEIIDDLTLRLIKLEQT